MPAEGGVDVVGGDTGNVKFQPLQQHAARVLERAVSRARRARCLRRGQEVGAQDPRPVKAVRKWLLRIGGLYRLNTDKMNNGNKSSA